MRVNHKKVRLKPPVSQEHLRPKRDKEVRNLRMGYEYVREKRLKIYYQDECSFSAKNFKDTAWSNAK